MHRGFNNGAGGSRPIETSKRRCYIDVTYKYKVSSQEIEVGSVPCSTIDNAAQRARQTQDVTVVCCPGNVQVSDTVGPPTSGAKQAKRLEGAS